MTDGQMVAIRPQYDGDRPRRGGCIFFIDSPHLVEGAFFDTAGKRSADVSAATFSELFADA
jgi:hypothetical protein